MTGTLVNVGAVLLGSFIGLAVGARLPEKIKRVLFTALGLATLAIGLGMAMKTESIILLIGSLALGGILGEVVDIEGRLEALAEGLKARLSPGGGRADDARRFATGFVTASLVYCVGAMTVVGAIREGVSGNPDILLAKSMLDGVASIVFAATLGIGVAFSALTVLVVQGSLTILGSQLKFLVEGAILRELSATGGLLILAIGLCLLEIKQISVANLLPSLAFAVLFSFLFLN